MRLHGTPEQLERRRRRALELLDKGTNPSDTAKEIGCSRNSVYYWKRLREENGDEGLRPKPAPGRPSKLNARQKKSLIGVLVGGAMKKGYSTDLWTTRRIAQVIGKKFRVSYHPNSVWWLLHEMGMSYQKPATRARERDEKEIAHWKRHKWPHIKKVRKA